jgi:hypothetical protein
MRGRLLAKLREDLAWYDEKLTHPELARKSLVFWQSMVRGHDVLRAVIEEVEAHEPETIKVSPLVGTHWYETTCKGCRLPSPCPTIRRFSKVMGVEP